MKRPSRDQSVPQPPGVPILISTSSWPAPVAALMYRSYEPLRLEGNSTRSPSEDQMGELSDAGSKVNREVTPRSRSRTQMSVFEDSVRSKTILLSSGARRR